MTATHEIYATTRDHLIDQLRAMDNATAERTVDRCPAWTVKDLAAHLSGLVAEVTGEVEPPYGSDEATTRQVSSRVDMTLAEICDEWSGNADAIAAAMQDGEQGTMIAAGLTGDLIVHIHDLWESLDRPIDKTDAATVLGAQGYAARLQQRVADRLNIALTIDFGNGEVLSPAAADTAASAATEMKLTASHFDFLRAVTGRRSRSEVHALQWSADPTTLVDEAWRQYGEFDD